MLFDLRRDLPGGKEVGEEGRAPGGDGLGEGEEEVQQDPHPPASFEVDQAGLPRDLDPDWRWPCLGPSPRRLRPG